MDLAKITLATNNDRPAKTEEGKSRKNKGWRIEIRKRPFIYFRS